MYLAAALRKSQFDSGDDRFVESAENGGCNIELDLLDWARVIVLFAITRRDVTVFRRVKNQRFQEWPRVNRGSLHDYFYGLAGPCRIDIHVVARRQLYLRKFCRNERKIRAKVRATPCLNGSRIDYDLIERRSGVINGQGECDFSWPPGGF